MSRKARKRTAKAARKAMRKAMRKATRKATRKSRKSLCPLKTTLSKCFKIKLFNFRKNAFTEKRLRLGRINKTT